MLLLFLGPAGKCCVTMVPLTYTPMLLPFPTTLQLAVASANKGSAAVIRDSEVNGCSFFSFLLRLREAALEVQGTRYLCTETRQVKTNGYRCVIYTHAEKKTIECVRAHAGTKNVR